MFTNIYEHVKSFMKKNALSIILILVVFICIFVRVPYEVEMPGGTINLSNRVLVDGKEASYSGTFNMAYVSVIEGSIPYTFFGLIHPDWEVIKMSDVVSENETIQTVNERNKIYLEQSKNSAIIAGLEAAHIPYTLENKHNQVIYVSESAKTSIEIGDFVLACDDQEIEDVEQIRSIINSKKEGDSVSFLVEREGEKSIREAIVYKEEGTLYAGISVATTHDIVSEKKIEITSKASESGPSGGFMMALMVYSSLTNQDLTKGRKIVGTGTISIDGTVGEIGGVKYKVMGAAKEKADIFLVPHENYEEAVRVKEEKKYNLEIVEIASLQDGIDYLEGLDE